MPAGAGGVRCQDCGATAAATGDGRPITLWHYSGCVPMHGRAWSGTFGRRFRQLLLTRIAADRDDVTVPLRVERLERFSRSYHGDIGEVEVTYNEAGHRAIYGFDATARISLYAD